MNRRLAGLSFVLAVAVLATISMGGDALTLDDDPELRAFQGRQLVQNDCLMCHTTQIIASQRLSADQWKAEITKMIGWGAPVTPEEQPVLLEYLSTTYGSEVPPVRPSRITIKDAEKALASQWTLESARIPRERAERGGPLFAKHCASCHGPDALGGEGGTNLVQKPILDRRIEAHEVIQSGRNRMPGFKMTLDHSQMVSILDWLFYLGESPEKKARLDEKSSASPKGGTPAK